VEHGWRTIRRAGMVLKPCPRAFGEQFGLRTGHEGVRRNLDLEPAEARGPDDVLERFAATAAADGLAKRVKDLRAEHALELEVELEPRQLEKVGKEELHLEAGGGHTAFLEVGGAALDDVEETHGGQVALAGPLQQT